MRLRRRSIGSATLGRGRADAARELIWIDHHRSNDGRGTIRLVDPAASSTCELCGGGSSMRSAGGSTDDAALCLYAGLVTDTGRFQYEATTPETLRVAASLREHPFDHARLVQALYDDNRARPSSRCSGGRALARWSRRADLVWTYVLRADLERTGADPGDADDLIDVIRDRARHRRRGGAQAAARRPVQGERAVPRRARPRRASPPPSAAAATAWPPATPVSTVPPGTIERLRAVLAGAPATA